MRKLGCNASALLGNSTLDNMEIIKQVGFDSTFVSWNEEIDLKEYAKKASSLGLELETVHSPFGKMNDLWVEGNDGDHYTEVLRRCIIDAGKNGVPCVIMHATIGHIVPKTSHIGLTRFEKLIIEARRCNVKLAFENLEFFRHLGLILEYFKNEDNVGFCYDVGHEHCYTPGMYYMTQFADRLLCTHIHDNLGLAETKDVDYRDDLHKIPFDGNIDFERVCKGIKNSGFEGTLMLEVSNRQPYFFYKDLTALDFYKKAYGAATKLRTLTDGN